MRFESNSVTPTLRHATSAETSCPEETSTVYIVEDDADLRQVLAWIVTCAGHKQVTCSCGEEALQVICPNQLACVLLDLHLPDMNGLELRRQLLARGCQHPFVVLTGSRDVDLAVQSMKDGALDFVQKPFDRTRLLRSVDDALVHARKTRLLRGCADALTMREREVLSAVGNGRTTKEIARQFGISPRTVDVHRHNIMKKTGAKSILQLVRLLDGGSQMNSTGHSEAIGTQGSN